MTVLRYTPNGHAYSEGLFVLHSDYAALEARCAELEAIHSRYKGSRLSAMVDELDRYKSALEKISKNECFNSNQAPAGWCAGCEATAALAHEKQ